MRSRPPDRYLAFERALDRMVGPPLVQALSRLPARRKAAGAPRRVLAVKLHGIGNVILLLPALRLLRRAFPDATIDFLSFSTNAGILEGTPEVDGLHLLDRTNLATLARSFARLGPRLVAGGYDLVVDFDQFAHIATLAALLTRAPRRVGYRTSPLARHRGYTDAVVLNETVHVSASFVELAVRAAGKKGEAQIDAGDRRVALEPRHHAEAAAFEAAAGIPPEAALVLLHPGTSENLLLRRWPAERFAALGSRLGELPGVRVVVSGSPEERGLVERVRAAMTVPSAATPGKLSLKGFVALCARAELVVANDTAAVHIASAMGTPVVGLYGPNTPALYGPTGGRDLVFSSALPCSPCITNSNAKVSRCRDARCMAALAVDEVFDAMSAAYFDAQGRVLPRFKKDRGKPRVSSGAPER